MTRKQKKYRKNFTLVIFFILVSTVVLLLTTNKLKVTLAKDLASSEDVRTLKVLTDADQANQGFFDSLTGKNIIFVSSSWCGSCDLFRREINEELQKNDDINFYEIDLDYFRSLELNYEVKVAPAVIIMNDGTYNILNSVSTSDFSAAIKLLSSGQIFQK